MTKTVSKNVQKALRQFAGIAYERELSAAAQSLQIEFSRWGSGAIDVFELNEKIHEFHQGVSRELYSRYAVMDAAFAVASAVRRGVLTRAEIGEPVYLSVEGIVMSLDSLREHSDGPDA
ncbi:MAG: hypothetical protein F9K30_22470 [Dechloromonas sp.]|nr:MAG: hypothetical protein F9K30_22470 [Dechloromonas sp.]